MISYAGMLWIPWHNVSGSHCHSHVSPGHMGPHLRKIAASQGGLAASPLTSAASAESVLSAHLFSAADTAVQGGRPCHK